MARKLMLSFSNRAPTRRVKPRRHRDAIHQPFDLRELRDLAGRDPGDEGRAPAASNQAELGFKPASAAAQCVVEGLIGVAPAAFWEALAAARQARKLVPSMHHRARSIVPSRSRRIHSALRMRPKARACCQLSKWCYAVCHGPGHSGSSRHGAPVCRIQNMALSSVRRSSGGRPVLAHETGTSGSLRSHCQSVRSSRLMCNNFQVRRGDLHAARTHRRQINPFSDRV